MLVRKARVVPFECVVRGYLSGSGWKEYKATGTVCGIRLPPGLVESEGIDPIFTPATKAETGHDENVSFEVMAQAVGIEVATTLRSLRLEVYRAASAHTLDRGVILADTKFEWGFDRRPANCFLSMRCSLPTARDSGRWIRTPGAPPPSFDKQFVRDWLETTGWDKASPPPELPENVVAGTRSRYIEAYERLSGRTFPWK